MSSGLLAKRSRAEIASAMMKKIRRQIAGRPTYKPIRKGKVEGVIRGKAVSGTDAPEIKNVDLLQNTVTVLLGTPYSQSLSLLLAQGVGGAQRIGLKAVAKSVDIVGHGTALVGNTATLASCPPAFIDFFVVWDKQPNGVVPAPSTVFSNAAANGDLVFGNIGFLDRFVILRRHRMCFDMAKGVSETFQLHIPLDLDMRFPDATSPAYTNDILIYALTTQTTTGATQIVPQLSYLARMKFIDA